MRIGTWNLAGRWTPEHLGFIQGLRCDVLLLTEVRGDVAVPGMQCHATTEHMAEDRWWAAVLAPELMPLPDPHGASASALVDDLKVCSTVLPWRASGGDAPWKGGDTGHRAANAVARIVESRPEVWGGDWNTSLEGRDWVGTRRGRAAVVDATRELGLAVHTSAAPHRDTDQRAIDHVAVPEEWLLTRVDHVVAAVEGRYLSDHDAYVVETDPATVRA
ncbi:hypothetical protein GCM10009623_24590 [Nocardioides aestuarii]|uniref:Endonuclease/exonuclease/phosphatase family protein n=1 Tax=Nocardioides aestuarii TaxID=252231 RepID=A0ABW4TRC9_9ACTN